MAARRLLTVICYDVSEARPRRRLAERLEEIGVRVQKSVFEAWLTERQIDALVVEVRALLALDDSLRVYAVGTEGFACVRSLGPAPPPSEDGYYLV